MSPERLRMLALLLGCVVASVANAQTPKSYAPYPEPGSGYVTDHADLLTEAEEERIEQWLWQVESRSSVEIIVVTIRSMADYPGARTDSIESFATGLFDTWKIGNLPSDDGVLFLVSARDRKARIELGAGYGRLRDADAPRIMSEVIVPAFRDGDMAGGVTEGTRAIAEEFASVRIGFPWQLVWMVGGALAFGLIGVSLLMNGKRGWGWVFVGLAIVLLLAALFLLLAILRHMPKSRSSGWASGGLGGFGGGSSGGGGASGSW